MATVTFENVLKQYGDFVAIPNLNLTIRDKEFLVLVGPSGCGKSTALRCIAGLEEISGGDIKIGDRIVTDVPPKDRDIAMVFQSYALYPHMSVYDNMAFGLKLRKVPKSEIDKRVTKAAESLGIKKFLDRKPKALSGGQRQRVALGRAIVRDPSVFLFDEPLSNLDAKLRVQTRAEIATLHQQLGTTFVYVTHDQVEAMTMADRIAVMKDGILHQCDSPQNLYNRPVNVFVGGFIGSPSMNFFDATITGDRRELYVDTGAFRIRLSGKHADYLAKDVSRRVIFGVRPEDIHHPEYLPSGVKGPKAKAKVELLEMMGAEINVFMIAGEDQRFIARVDPRAHFRVGDTVEMVFNIDTLHLFDSETEKSLFNTVGEDSLTVSLLEDA
ncbi:MAG: glycerol-3-phosphate ABC transporter ATP-binding protein [Anaerolineaceae bacterium 4572_78]|nr:MAG: glycerol-3-phosphate ABC transporter ATP-binding protein [Anaerolineaceae bacterium 4572_78]